MKWIVGVDLLPSCAGALAMGQWLAGDRPGKHEFVYLHVIEGADVIGPDAVSVDLVRQDVQRFLENQHSRLGEIRVVAAERPELGLSRAPPLYDADAFLIGRRSTRAGDELVRLGRVARRVLRTLPAPVLVNPADLDADQLPKGPVMLAAEASDDCVGAAKFARAFAKSVDRPVAVSAVVPAPFQPGITYLPTARYHSERSQEIQRRVRQWLADNELADVNPLFAEGAVVPCLLQAAVELQACTIVCGSRLLALTSRIAQSSVGSTLAGTAPVPVAVVPPV